MLDSAQSQRSRIRTNSPAQWASNIFIALLPVLACFLGGSSQKWAEGIVVGLLGAYLLVRPPRASLGIVTNCMVIALVALAVTAFLPANWFFMPEWRRAVVNDFGISLPPQLSPQPWLSASCLVSLIAAIAWLYVVCTQELGLRSARFQLRLFVVAIVFLAAICIALYWAHGAFPFWKNERGFGPFPNRNHTADLFGISAIVLLACGQDDIRHGRSTWFVWLLALAVLVAAIILDYSRAGIVILVAGSGLWISIVALRQRSPARLALGVSFLLLMLTTLLLMGGETLERFHLRGLGGAGISTDFRWRIFRDAFQLIRASPWCGIGLGNFSAVFAIFRAASLGNTRAFHPESDWLWLWSEMGWMAVVLAIIGTAFLIRRALPLREGTNQRFRLAALIGALIFAAHGLIDVPGHKIGTGFAAIFLLGLSLHRPLAFKPSRWVMPLLFRLLGLLFLSSGILWIVVTQQTALISSSLGADNARQLADIANRGRNFKETIALTTRALEWTPLDWQLYFLRAIGEVGARQPLAAVEDFRRARFLEPNAYEVPLAEGNIWMPSNLVLAATAWREALRRAGPEKAGVYRTIVLNAPKNNPVVTQLLEETALQEPDLALAYLREITGATFNNALARLLKTDPDLRTLNDPQKRALFALWSERGNQDGLARAVTEHPDWLQYAWLGMARYHAGKNNFRDAYQLTQRFGEAVALPRISENDSVEELKKRFSASPENYAIGYALYRKQIQNGQIDDALQTVRHFTERPTSPIYFRYLEAEGWAAKENWERAWNAWQAFWSAKTQASK